MFSIHLSDRRRPTALAVTLALVAGAGTAFSSAVLYRAAIQAQRSALRQLAQSHARLIEQGVRFESALAQGTDVEGAMQATIGHVLMEEWRSTTFGDTGEFVLAKRRGSDIVFLGEEAVTDPEAGLPTEPWISDRAEPMRRALKGESGVTSALDYRGVVVLAAYQPVPGTGLGVVAKVDIAEIRAPYVRAGVLGGAATVMLILLGWVLLRTISCPLVNRLETTIARLENAQRIAGLGNWECDLRSKVGWWDKEAERILGAPSDGSKRDKSDYLAHVHPEDRERVEDCLTMLPNAREPVSVDHRIVLSDGKERWVNVVARPSREWPGKPHHVAGTIQDITIRKRVEEQFLHVQKMETVGTLAAGIAHNFNNMLVPILGFTRMVHEKLDRGDANRAHLDRVLSAGERAKRMVEQILTFSEQMDVAHDTVQLEATVPDALELIEASVPPTVRIEEAIELGLPPILADVSQMHQILASLSANAVHAMRSGGGVLRVSVEVVEVDGKIRRIHPKFEGAQAVQLTVSDTGEGMDEPTLARVYEPFFTTKEVGEGSGLGLSTVHGIVTSLGGGIAISSTPGVGTTVRIVFPPASVQVREGVSVESRPAPGGERLLFVDDEEGITALAERYLGDLGYDVHGVTTSREALASFKRNPQEYDLLIADQIMTDMTGTALAEEMMRIRPDLPVVLVTGRFDTMNATIAEARGIRGFVRKPFEMDELSRVIRSALDQEF